MLNMKCSRYMPHGEESLVHLRSDDAAELALVCIPQAGAGVAAFWHWRELLPNRIALWVARLPGRENRMMERPLTTIAAMADELAGPVGHLTAEDLILFGHCSGAFVAYELARRLALQIPARCRITLVVSSQTAPDVLGPIEDSFRDAPLEELTEVLRAKGGTDEAILANKQMMELLAPGIRADLEAACSYRPRHEKSLLNVPIVALAGNRDTAVNAAGLDAWRDYTSCRFSLHILDGDHFSIISDRRLVRHYLENLILA
jgi:medium-chain acyl-[acyl-carrier-protein] hydrolase